MRSVRLALRVFILVVSVAAAARAQPVDETRARADTLFREGQQLVAAGQVAAACAKLEESQRLDPKLGRLLNVAYCHDVQGRVATAWSEYNQAAALAVQTRQTEREQFARAQANALAKKLPFLRLNLAAAPEVTDVTVDGRPLARDQWAMPFAIDPGPHALTFAAAGRTTRTQSVTVAGMGTVRVDVGPLEVAPPTAPAPPAAPVEAPAPAPVPPPPAPEPPPAAHARTLAWIVGGVGVAALGVGAGFGLHAMALRNQADPECPNKLCTPHGKSLIDDASTAATVATVAFAVGAVGIGAGTWLLVRPLPTGGASVALQGAW